jgi:pyruvate dehydrogenase E1 component beta subunit
VHELRAGDEVTVLTWGEAVDPAVLAAETAGPATAVVDLGCLAPLDVEGIVAAASRTGKVVIVHAGPRTHGLGAELAAIVADRCITSLDAPVVRVTGASGLRSPHDEWLAVPTPSEIADAILQAAHY